MARRSEDGAEIPDDRERPPRHEPQLVCHVLRALPYADERVPSRADLFRARGISQTGDVMIYLRHKKVSKPLRARILSRFDLRPSEVPEWLRIDDVMGDLRFEN